MSSIICPDCGKQLSSRTTFSRCPKCGCPIEVIMKSHRRKTLAPVAIVCALFITGLFVGEDKDKKTTDAKENIEQAAPAKSEKKAPAKSKKAKAVETVSEVPEEVITEVVEEPEITETEEVQAVSEEDSTPTMPDAAPVTTVDEDTTLD